MKKIVIALLTTISGLVLLFSYRTSTEAVPPTALGSAPPTSQATTPATTPPTSQATTPATTSTGLVDGTYQGQSTPTQWGPVQVQVTVSGGMITDAHAIDYPSGNSRDQQINSYALPRLDDEALAAQSAHIDMVSGATVTSVGYLTSLQSALDQARG